MQPNAIKKFTAKQASRLLPTRRKSDHKASAGKSLIIAGSKGMYGAAVLAATAASRVGSGYVFLMTDSKNFNSTKSPDFLVTDWKTKKIVAGFTAVAIGPGVGNATAAKHWLKILINSKAKNVVIDADALNFLAKKIPNIRLPATWIATPHEGEMSRLLNKTSNWVRTNRRLAVVEAQKKLGCLVLLKGHHSLLATGEDLFVVISGNAALAKAGTGDVLTGMITGFLAQGLMPKEAALVGAFVHGKVADDWITAKKDILSLMASDINCQIPTTLYKLRKIR